MNAQELAPNVTAFGRLWGEIHNRKAKIIALLKKNDPGQDLTDNARVESVDGHKTLVVTAHGQSIKIMLHGTELKTDEVLTLLATSEDVDDVRALRELYTALREAWVSQEGPIMRRAYGTFSDDEIRLLGT